MEQYDSTWTEEQSIEAMLHYLLLSIRATCAGGAETNNALAELRYVKEENGDAYVVPVFEDGSGAPCEYFPHGYYAVNVTACSTIAVMMTVVKEFVCKMW